MNTSYTCGSGIFLLEFGNHWVVLHATEGVWNISTRLAGQSYLRTYPMTSDGRRGAITDLLTTSRHPFRSFDTLRDSAVRRQVQSLILSSHRFLWPPLLLPPLTVPCMIVFERPEDLETWPYHFSFLLLTVVSKSSYGPMARSILLRTSTFVMCTIC